MFRMAYPLHQPRGKHLSGQLPLDREKSRRAPPRRPCPATAGSQGRFRCFRSGWIGTPSPWSVPSPPV